MSGWGWDVCPTAELIRDDIRRAMKAMEDAPVITADVFLPALVYDAALMHGLPLGGYARQPEPEPLPMMEKAWTYRYPAPRKDSWSNAWENRQRAKGNATAKRVAASKRARKARKR